MEDALADCIERIEQGESLDGVLARYPDDREALRSLIETALAFASTPAEPDPAFRSAARLRFQGAVRSQIWQEERRLISPRFGGGISTWTRAMAGAAAVVVVMVGFGGGLTVASASANPENLLYGVKRLNERFQLAITPSEDRRAELLLSFVGRRATELTAMAKSGNVRQIDRLQRDMVRHIELAQAEGGVTSAAMANRSGEMSVTASAASAERGAPPKGPSDPEAASASSQPSTMQLLAADARDDAVRGEDLRNVATDMDPHLAAAMSPFQEAYEQNLARLVLAQQHASAPSREALDRALSDMRSRYFAFVSNTGTDVSDPVDRVLLVQGVVAKHDGANWIGGQRVTDGEVRRLRAGEYIVIGGVRLPDGSIRPLVLQRANRTAPPLDSVAVQGTLVQTSDGRFEVAGYRIALPEGATLRREAVPGLWVEVRGLLLDNETLVADTMLILGGSPVPFSATAP